MKYLYSKLLIIVTLLIGSSINSQAQDWMVGDVINDTIKYLLFEPMPLYDSTSCYDNDTPDGYFAFHTCPDPGIDYGYVVEELVSSDTVEITPGGVIELGDTIWCTELPLWVIIERKIYFHNPDGHMKLRFFAVGEVTMPDVGVFCQPADSMWMQQLAVCNNLWWYDYPHACTTFSNPLGIEDISLNELNILYPSRLNSYTLSSESDENIRQMRIYDIQGRVVAESSLSNSVDCSVLNSGSYIVSIELESGNILKKKFMLTK